MKTEICHQIFFENQIEKAAYSDKHTEKRVKRKIILRQQTHMHKKRFHKISVISWIHLQRSNLKLSVGCLEI